MLFQTNIFKPLPLAKSGLGQIFSEFYLNVNCECPLLCSALAVCMQFPITPNIQQRQTAAETTLNRITALKVRTRGRKLAFIQGHDWSLTIFFEEQVELY